MQVSRLFAGLRVHYGDRKILIFPYVLVDVAPDYSYLRHMAKRSGRPLGLTPDGPEIHRLRVGLGLTAPQLAAEVGHHPESLRRAEAGRRISEVFASRLARAFGVTIRDITKMPDEDESEPETPDRISA